MGAVSISTSLVQRTRRIDCGPARLCQERCVCQGSGGMVAGALHVTDWSSVVPNEYQIPLY